MRYHIILLLTIGLFTSQKGLSQNLNVKGKIIDYETNQIIIGATIIPEDTQEGALSDKNGYFEINDNTQNLEICFVGYYILRFINIPQNQKNIDFGAIRLIQNYLKYNNGAGVPDLPVNDDFIEQDKRLKEIVLNNYRIKLLGKKLKPYFEGNYIVFDFKNETTD